MTHEAISQSSALRSDLIRLPDAYAPRRWTIVDAISGRIWRLTRQDWKRLEHLDLARVPEHDVMLERQAAATGLLRRRPVTRWTGWTFPLRIVSFRIPIGSIDPLATWLAPRSAVLFSPIAVIAWVCLALLALLSVLIGWPRTQDSVATVYQAAGSATAMGYSFAAIFVFTKCLHELGHATVCRRVGVPVGDVGVFFFCGIPCPYCDVSQVWRNDSRLQRAAVMLAGVYSELVLASIATWVWWLTAAGPLHLLAMNTMLVSGVSAIAFNANPLMRLDGYYVLSDCLGTPNLRRQAWLAWHGVVVCPAAGISTGRARVTRLSAWLSLYHVLSTGYRWIVGTLVMIFVVKLLREWDLGSIGLAIIAGMVCMLIYKASRQWTSMIVGRGHWSESPWLRRLGINVAMLAILALLLSLPARREVWAPGYIDVDGAVDVFVPESAWVARVDREFADRVEAGEPLATFDDDQLNIELASFKSRRAMAMLESEHLKRAVLHNVDSDVAWKLDRANRDLVTTQYLSLVNRRARLSLAAPTGGVLLPPPDRHGGNLAAKNGPNSHSASLRDRQGTFVEGRTRWCRIGDPAQCCAVIRITAEQRQQLVVGSGASILIDDGTIRQIHTWIETMDAIPAHLRPPGDAAAYVVKCRLPCELFAGIRSVPPGAKIEARLSIDREAAWKWLWRSANEMLSG